jgi:hypothetical protein
MKGKSLLVAGLVLGAGAASSFAQTVYSVNAVGFVNRTLAPGFNLISNPLNAPTNTLTALFPSGAVPNGTSVFQFDGANFVGSSFLFGNWSLNLTNVPGGGFFIKNPAATNITVTFVGNVQQGTLTTPLPAGFWITSSQVPQKGLVTTDLLLPVANGDSVFRFTNNAYVGSSFLFGNWSGGEPELDVGEAFFVKKSAPVNWVRTFSVSQ